MKRSLMEAAKLDFEFEGIYGEEEYIHTDGTRGMHTREKNKLVSECEVVFGENPSINSIRAEIGKANLTSDKLREAAELLNLINEVVARRSAEPTEMEETIYDMLLDCHGKSNCLLYLGALAILLTKQETQNMADRISDVIGGL